MPHRYPCLLLDRVLELDEKRATGYKNVTINEPYFRGHFPHFPVMPGVLQIESLLQLAWIFLGRGFRVVRIERLKFRRQVVPGDRLDLQVELLEREGERYRLRCQALVEEKTAMQGDFTLEAHSNSQTVPVSVGAGLSPGALDGGTVTKS
ncbi:MAG: hypothetical protein AMXMBFR33_26520 [Candidatus Xenobia bacterium]